MKRTTRADKGRGRVAGLAIRTCSTGEVTYWFRYRLGGRMRTWTFKAEGLAEARRRAEAARVTVANGEDPRPRRATARALTVGRAAALWLRSREALRWRPRTRKEMRGLVARHLLPGFRARDANSLSRGEVRKALDALAERHPVTANRTHGSARPGRALQNAGVT